MAQDLLGKQQQRLVNAFKIYCCYIGLCFLFMAGGSHSARNDDETSLDRHTLRTDVEQSIVDLMVLLDNKYAKQMKDMDENQRENARYFTGILKLVMCSIKVHETTFDDLPDDIKEPCKMLEAHVGHEWRRFGVALGIPECAIDKLEGTNRLETFWKVIQFRHSLGPIKIQDLQMAYFRVKRVCMENVSAMPTVHKEIVEVYKGALYMDVVDAIIVLSYMRCFIYIPPETVKYVISPDTKYGRMANLIDTMPTIGWAALQVFTDSLFHSGHEFLARQIRESVRERGVSFEDPKPVPIDENDRMFLHRKSRLERSPRVNEEIQEIRQIMMNKIQKQLDEEEIDCAAQF